ncbi:kinase [Streptomyces katrae]|uniref:Kinase n=1 Tax=Streptomyces katrae TaxID=68223 RepID=A0ABT7GR89_9ACTN|nr:kinase [Streptomyces katrae]MDK9496102.1 kinase [Streptomyces katrae]
MDHTTEPPRHTHTPPGGGAGVGRAPGTFGELLQGALPGNGHDFLVTFPIQNWSTALFRTTPGRRDVEVRPAHKHKSRRLAQAALHHLGVTDGGILTLHGALPEGKGLASSSADLVATARAVADAHGRHLDPATIETLLRGIEPTDGVMYEGIVAFYHREVRLREVLGHLPPLTVIAHDEGGAVDTIGFNRTRKPHGPAEREEYARLLDTLAAAVQDHDLPTVGRVATRSAELNRLHRPRRDFAPMLRACRDIDGLGLVVAHSGTALGVLLDHCDPEHDLKTAHVRAACAGLPGTVDVHRSLSAHDPTTPTAYLGRTA